MTTEDQKMEFTSFVAPGTPTWITRVAMLIRSINTPQREGDIRRLLRVYSSLRAGKPDPLRPAQCRDRRQHLDTLLTLLHSTIFVVEAKVTEGTFPGGDARYGQRITTVGPDSEKPVCLKSKIGKTPPTNCANAQNTCILNN